MLAGFVPAFAAADPYSHRIDTCFAFQCIHAEVSELLMQLYVPVRSTAEISDCSKPQTTQRWQAGNNGVVSVETPIVELTCFLAPFMTASVDGEVLPTPLLL